MEGYLHSDYGKMGLGVMRYHQNPIVGIIDTANAGSNINQQHPIDRDIPIFNKLDQVVDQGAEVLLLGIAPSGGKIPDTWLPLIEQALGKGLSIINGLHDPLSHRFSHQILKHNQWIWDVRIPQFLPEIASGQAAQLNNKRLLMIGTDMACGKMTTGLEIYHWTQQNHFDTGFVATGQIGITIMGSGIPLDAIKVDHAQFLPEIASGQAAQLNNKRLLMIGTDMACGKMTTGLEIYHWTQQNHFDTGFVATGQIGITIMGSGIPLDAIKVDHACGAVEQMVMYHKHRSLVVIEGQGSLLHPGSSATLPLMRGACPTHMILCHRADKTTLRHTESIKIPPLKEFIALNESLASVLGTYGKPKVMGVALNTVKLTEKEALNQIDYWENELNIPVTDVIRFGVEKLVKYWL